MLYKVVCVKIYFKRKAVITFFFMLSDSKLIMVNVGNFFQLGVASDLTGDIIGSSMLDEDVISVLKIFNHQVCLIMTTLL